MKESVKMSFFFDEIWFHVLIFNFVNKIQKCPHYIVRCHDSKKHQKWSQKSFCIAYGVEVSHSNSHESCDWKVNRCQHSFGWNLVSKVASPKIIICKVNYILVTSFYFYLIYQLAKNIPILSYEETEVKYWSYQLSELDCVCNTLFFIYKSMVWYGIIVHFI